MSRSVRVLITLLCSLTLMSCSDAAKTVRDIATEASKALEPSLVGKWNTTMLGYPHSFEFRSNGTYHEHSEGWLTSREFEGHYELLDNARVKITTPGDLWGTNEMIWTYSITDDKLTLKAANGVKFECTQK